jgi:integrase
MAGRRLVFPYRYTKNGRHGKIYRCSNQIFKTHFIFAHKAYQNTFSTFENALAFLENEFDKLDDKPNESPSLFPLERDRKHYHELELRLKLETDKASLWQAVDFYIAHHKRKRLEPYSVNDCIEKFIASRIASNASTSQIRNLLKHCRRFAIAFGDRKIHEIEAAEIEHWFNSQKDQNTGTLWQPKTRKNYRGSLVAMSLYARKILKAIPSTGEETEFQKSSCPKIHAKSEVEIYTPDQIKKILDAAIDRDIDLIPIIVLGAFMGLRPTECHGEDLQRRKLHWEDFVWKDNYLALWGQKVNTKASRHIPIPQNAKLWLKPFLNLKGEIWRLKSSFDEKFAAIKRIAEVESVYDGLRHGYASYRIRILRGEIDKLAEEMGNSREEIFRSYKRNVTDQLALQWFGIKPPRGYESKIKKALTIRQTK